MRPIFIFLLLSGAAIFTWLIAAKPEKKKQDTKQQAIAVSKRSDSYNQSLSGLINVYVSMQEDFVNWDSVKVKDKATDFGIRLNDLKLDELKKDSSAIFETAALFIQNAKGDAQTIASESNIRPQREAFNSLTDNLYQFLNTIKYDREKLYLQECPMAFDDTKAALWLSRKEEIRNPYLGLHHPTYGKGMLSCGETKTQLNNTGVK